MIEPGSFIAAVALALPDVGEGVACAGTKLESRTFDVRKKSFLFVSKTQLRLKLAASASDARERGFPVGANGWATLPLDGLPSGAVLKRWIAESHALAAGTDDPAAATRPSKRPR